MSLLSQIIDDAVEDKIRLVTILRKCLVLADQLGNTTLAEWASNELNGYPTRDSLPSYRIGPITAKGFFVGPFGVQINDQPIPPAALKKEHRDWAIKIYLNEPITSYERISADPDKNGCSVVNWPADLTTLYQNKFFEGEYVLNRAWQEVPMGMVAAIVDTVRTRILQFALEIKRELGDDAADMVASEPAKVEHAVQTIILGGTNVIAGHVGGDVQMVAQQVVIEGDFNSLSRSLTQAGVGAEHVTELRQAIEEDQADGADKGFGKCVTRWLQSAGSFVGKESAKAASGAAGKAITAAVLSYFGMSA